jgi:acyl-CoA reductase-like NAD-dependent aldehyde dehydrogenase
MTFDAFWLPLSFPVAELHTLRLPAGGVIRYPALTGKQISSLARSLRAAGQAAQHITVRERMHAIADAAALLVDPREEFAQIAGDLIPDATGYSPEMTRVVLGRMAKDWSLPELDRLLQSEFVSPEVLDRFTIRPHGRRQRAMGPALAAHIFAGNVPGVSVTSLVRTLLVKSASFGKTASQEPVLPVLFARALARVHPALANTLGVTYWPGGTAELDGALCQAADTIIVYGGADVVDAARKASRPTSRLVVHGPRISIGLVAQPALADTAITSTADEIAQAVAYFDQQGCVSPHLVYVLGPLPLAANLAQQLATALDRFQRQVPRGRLSAAEAIQVQEARARAEFRAIAGEGVVLHAGNSAAFTVVLDPRPDFEPSCLNRFVYVKPLPDVDHLTTLIAPVAAFLQSVGVAGFALPELETIAARLGQLGVSRIAAFPTLPWPPPDWHHDGSEPLRELVRWVDLDP